MERKSTGQNGGGYTSEAQMFGCVNSQEALMFGGGYGAETQILGDLYSQDTQILGDGYSAETMIPGGGFGADAQMFGGGRVGEIHKLAGGYGAETQILGGVYSQDTQIHGDGYSSEAQIPGVGYGTETRILGGGYGVEAQQYGGVYSQEPQMFGGGYGADTRVAATVDSQQDTSLSYNLHQDQYLFNNTTGGGYVTVNNRGKFVHQNATFGPADAGSVAAGKSVRRRNGKKLYEQGPSSCPEENQRRRDSSRAHKNREKKAREMEQMRVKLAQVLQEVAGLKLVKESQEATNEWLEYELRNSNA